VFGLGAGSRAAPVRQKSMIDLRQTHWDGVDAHMRLMQHHQSQQNLHRPQPKLIRSATEHDIKMSSRMGSRRSNAQDVLLQQTTMQSARKVGIQHRAFFSIRKNAR
jgi:hypothetical protein